MAHTVIDQDLLLVIDPQIDFCPGGNLAIPDGDAVIPVINQLAASFHHVVLTQDWHPDGHSSFASTHPGRSPYATIQAPYGPQTLWPDHCIQHSAGAQFHPDLEMPNLELILRKGFRPAIDSYSAFQENDRQTPTGLAGYLRERGFPRIFLAGLAYDYCVRYSALDAVNAGFEALVIEDACRAVGLPGSVADTNLAFAAAGVHRIQTAAILPPAA
jgi:nicotinamidase/pyrazinamidase